MGTVGSRKGYSITTWEIRRTQPSFLGKSGVADVDFRIFLGIFGELSWHNWGHQLEIFRITVHPVGNPAVSWGRPGQTRLEVGRNPAAGLLGMWLAKPGGEAGDLRPFNPQLTYEIPRSIDIGSILNHIESKFNPHGNTSIWYLDIFHVFPSVFSISVTEI